MAYARHNAEAREKPQTVFNFTDSTFIFENPNIQIFTNNCCPTHGRNYDAQRSGDSEDEALKEPSPPTDVSSEFSPEDLQRMIEEVHLSQVASNCKPSRSVCDRLGRYLRTPSSSMIRLQEEHMNDWKEILYQLLLEWKRRNATVTVQNLVDVLCQSDMSEVALELKHILRALHSA